MKKTILLITGLAGLVLLGCEPSEPAVVGTLERHRISLVGEASEPIVELAVREGDRVISGQLILSLDTSRIDTSLTQARARLANVQGRLNELLRGPRQEAISETRANLSESEAVQTQAEQEFNRVSQLVERQLLASSRLDDARANRDAARARVASATARLTAQLDGTTREELDQAEAAVTEAQAAIDQLQISKERLQIIAPVAGVVEAMPFRQGERPPLGAALAIVLADQPVFARVYLPEEMRARLNPGDAAQIVMAGTERQLQGSIRYIASDASYTPFYALTEQDRGRLTYLTEIDIQGDTRNLPTGIPLSLTFPDLND